MGSRPIEECGDPHGEERPDQGGLPSDPVAEVSENNRADRTGHKGDPEGRHGRQEGRPRVTFLEEEEREDRHGGCGVDVEIVELNRRADHAGHDDPAARYAGSVIGLC